MFRWYQEADICIAYLADIRYIYPRPADYVEYLGDSNWFTRGWTLQELLAPREVEFYSGDWEYLGSKNKITLVLERITGIDAAYLNGQKRVAEASVAERMSWASERQTTRVEDVAHCLLGIFNINMPLIYGERDKAFQRLQKAIIQEIDDQTILAWGTGFVGQGGFSQCHGENQPLLAKSPCAFRDCGDLVPCSSPKARSRLEILQDAARITCPILWDDTIDTNLKYNPLSARSSAVLLAPLQCRWRNDFFNCITLVLRCEEIDHSAAHRTPALAAIRLRRATQGWYLVPRKTWWTEPLRSTLVQLDAPTELSYYNTWQDEGFIVRSLPEGYTIMGYHDPTATRRCTPPSLRIPKAHPCGLSHSIIVKLGKDQHYSLALIIRYRFRPARKSFPRKPSPKGPGNPETSASSGPNYELSDIRSRLVHIPNDFNLAMVAEVDEADVMKAWEALKATRPEHGRFMRDDSLDYPSSQLQEYTGLSVAFLKDPEYGDGVFMLDINDSQGQSVSAEDEHGLGDWGLEPFDDKEFASHFPRLIRDSKL